MLILYPLDMEQIDLPVSPPIIGIAVSFPKSNTAREISYTVNNIFTQIGDYDDF